MKLLRCKLCHGEMEIVGNYRAIVKKVKCKKCNFNNINEKEKKEPEVFVIKRKVQ